MQSRPPAECFFKMAEYPGAGRSQGCHTGRIRSRPGGRRGAREVQGAGRRRRRGDGLRPE
eukprot:9377333-Lingulodinium_polyedra.AAC.1